MLMIRPLCVVERRLLLTHYSSCADEALRWSDSNNMSLNPIKTKEMVISFTKSSETLPPIVLDSNEIVRVDHAKLLGVIISSDLSWERHVNYIYTKACQRLHFTVLLRRAGVSAEDIIRF